MAGYVGRRQSTCHYRTEVRMGKLGECIQILLLQWANAPFGWGSISTMKSYRENVTSPIIRNLSCAITCAYHFSLTSFLFNDLTVNIYFKKCMLVWEVTCHFYWGRYLRTSFICLLQLQAQMFNYVVINIIDKHWFTLYYKCHETIIIVGEFVKHCM